MPRFLVLLLLALALPAWTDEPPSVAKEVLRQRLLQAYRAQDRVHYAVDFTITKDGSSLLVRGECCVEGDRAGVRLRLKDEEGEDAILMVTDGAVVALYRGGVREQTMEGPRMLREWLAPYGAARQRIATAFGVAIPPDEPYRVCPSLHFEEVGSEPRLLARLALEMGCAPRWLADEVWEGLEAELEEAEDRVVVRGENLTGRIALADGMPRSWESRNPRTNGLGAGAAAEPTLAVEAWRELIDDRCRGIDPTALTLSMRHEASFGPHGFLYAVMKCIPDLATNATRQAVVAHELASIGLGRIAAEDPKHHEAKVSRLVEDLRAIVRNHARDLAWPEVGAEAFGKAIAEALRSTGAGPGR